MMRRACPEGSGWLCGEDLQAFIDLEGIRPNNFAAATLRHLDGELRFPRGGGAGNDEETEVFDHRNGASPILAGKFSRIGRTN